MALNDIERRRIEKSAGAFVEKLRPAPHIRPKLDFGFRVSGQSVELLCWMELNEHDEREEDIHRRP